MTPLEFHSRPIPDLLSPEATATLVAYIQAIPYPKDHDAARAVQEVKSLGNIMASVIGAAELDRLWETLGI